MASTAMNIPQLQYVSMPLRQPTRSEYLARRPDYVFPTRAGLEHKNYSLKRDILPNLAPLSLRSQSPQRSEGSGSEANSPQKINSSRYKTELCRPFAEQESCKYGEKCQFAHGIEELRNIARHPKYKTELCRTFHRDGFCPYGPRCHFIHEDEFRQNSPKPSPSKPARVPLEQITNSNAFRNLFASFESTYASCFPTQLSVSLGSAGEYSPANSLSTSPVLSPAFSEDLSPSHPAHLSPVWPVPALPEHQAATIPRPQPVPCDHFQPRLQHFQPVRRSTDSTASSSGSYPALSYHYPDPRPTSQARGSPRDQQGASSRLQTVIPCSADERLPIFRRFSVEERA